MDQWDEHKTAILRRLRRAEGQVRGIAAMVEREEDCENVAQQLCAVRRALDKAFYEVMSCATQRALQDSGAVSPALAAELQQLNQLLVRYG